MSPALATLFRLVPPPIVLKLPSAFLVTGVPVLPARVTLFRSGLLGSAGSVSYFTANVSVAVCASLTSFTCSSVAARPAVAKPGSVRVLLLSPSSVPLPASSARMFVPLLTVTLPAPTTVLSVPLSTVRPVVSSVLLPAVTLSIVMSFASFTFRLPSAVSVTTPMLLSLSLLTSAPPFTVSVSPRSLCTLLPVSPAKFRPAVVAPCTAV